jgi:GNAT superfamily N-acetyltransferase
MYGKWRVSSELRGSRRMSEGGVQGAGNGEYALTSADDIDADRLIDFAARIWPDRPPYDRILCCWWRHASPDCANALVHQGTGTVVGLCAGRPSEWVVAGQVYPAVSICDFFVDPHHQGKLFGRRLLRSFEAPGRLVNAISISDIAAAYVARLGWRGPYASSLMAMPLPLFAKIGHSLIVGRAGLDLTDYASAGGQLPERLRADLDRIEAVRAHDVHAHMQRGAREWSWRTSIYPDNTYRFCVAYRDGEPVGYVAVRPMTPGRSRQMGRLRGALITDLVALHDDPATLRALAGRGVAVAAELRTTVALFLTTARSHRRALAAIGFVSPGFPVLGRLLARRAPTYMWLPRGPGAGLAAENMTMTFADSAVDLDL